MTFPIANSTFCIKNLNIFCLEICGAWTCTAWNGVLLFRILYIWRCIMYTNIYIFVYLRLLCVQVLFRISCVHIRCEYIWITAIVFPMQGYFLYSFISSYLHRNNCEDLLVGHLFFSDTFNSKKANWRKKNKTQLHRYDWMLFEQREILKIINRLLVSHQIDSAKRMKRNENNRSWLSRFQIKQLRMLFNSIRRNFIYFHFLSSFW